MVLGTVVTSVTVNIGSQGGKPRVGEHAFIGRWKVRIKHSMAQSILERRGIGGLQRRSEGTNGLLVEGPQGKGDRLSVYGLIPSAIHVGTSNCSTGDVPPLFFSSGNKAASFGLTH